MSDEKPEFRSALPKAVREMFEWAEKRMADVCGLKDELLHPQPVQRVPDGNPIFLNSLIPTPKPEEVGVVVIDNYGAIVAEHHRSCVLRQGGAECTC